MADWLRPKFQRTSSSFLDEDHPQMDGERVRNPSRVSSYLGLSSRPPTPSLAAAESFNIRNPDVVFEKPSTDLMVEGLKVAMMSKDSMEPLSIEYNSCVLHLLEAYQDLRETAQTKDQVIEDMKQTHTKEVKGFEERAAQWEAKEKDYKSEMKKLEVLLAHTEDGMEKVSLARSSSVLLRAPKVEPKSPSDQLVNANNAVHDRRGRVDLSFQQYSMMPPPPPELRGFIRRNTTDMKPQNPQVRRLQGVQARKDKSHRFQSKAATTSQSHKNPVGLGLTTGHLNELNRQNFESQLKAAEVDEKMEVDFGVTFGSSDSSKTSSSSNKELPSGRFSFDKPLPRIPETKGLEIETNGVDEALRTTRLPSSPWLDVSPTEQSPVQAHQNDFSFRPGDDAHSAFMAAETSRARVRRNLLEEQIREGKLRTQEMSRSKDASHLTVRPAAQEVIENEGPETSRAAQGPQKTMPAGLDPIRRRPELPFDVSRRNSSSSVVTAIRDNSGRSSANGSHTGGRKKLNRSSGSSDAATTAAARAFAASSGSGGSDRSSSSRKQKEKSSTQSEVLHEEKEEDVEGSS